MKGSIMIPKNAPTIAPKMPKIAPKIPPIIPPKIPSSMPPKANQIGAVNTSTRIIRIVEEELRVCIALDFRE